MVLLLLGLVFWHLLGFLRFYQWHDREELQFQLTRTVRCASIWPFMTSFRLVYHRGKR